MDKQVNELQRKQKYALVHLKQTNKLKYEQSNEIKLTKKNERTKSKN